MDLADMKNRIEHLNQRITAAARRSGRKREDILLLGVSKSVPAETINLAAKCGLYDFGENRVQEYLSKKDDVSPSARWHIVGRLQTNKAKYIAGQVCLIHSVDSLRLAGELNRQAEKRGLFQDILIEVNIGKEPAKGGVMPEGLTHLCLDILRFNHIKVRGLMTIPPINEQPERFFALMYQLFIDIKEKKIDNICMDYLSMGMSADFEKAIENGANIVRIGTALFGSRKAKE